MDILILTVASISFVSFLGIKIVMLRYLGSSKIIKGLMYSFVFVSVFHWIILFILFGFIVSFISYFIFSLLSLIFVWAILGVVTTSLRIQLLVTICNTKKGISHGQLIQKYNRNIITQIRLRRLLSAGEITYLKGNYYYNNKVSYFRIHMALILLLGKLYKVTNYKVINTR